MHELRGREGWWNPNCPSTCCGPPGAQTHLGPNTPRPPLPPFPTCQHLLPLLQEELPRDLHAHAHEEQAHEQTLVRGDIRLNLEGRMVGWLG